jgi:hypothetical protein
MQQCNSAVTNLPASETTLPHNMADASSSHSTAPAQHPENNLNLDGAGNYIASSVVMLY